MVGSITSCLHFKSSKVLLTVEVAYGNSLCAALNEMNCNMAMSLPHFRKQRNGEHCDETTICNSSNLYQSVYLGPCCSVSNVASCWCMQEGTNGWPKLGCLPPMCETQMEFLAIGSSLSQPLAVVVILGSESADGTHSIFPPTFSFSL